MVLKNNICNSPWRDIIVNYDGKCYNCCYQWKPFGDLSEKTFNEIWNGKEIRKIRKTILSGKFPDNCMNPSNICPFQGRI